MAVSFDRVKVGDVLHEVFVHRGIRDSHGVVVDEIVDRGGPLLICHEQSGGRKRALRPYDLRRFQRKPPGKRKATKGGSKA